MAQKIADKDQDFGRWYTDVVQQAELADYAPVKGCMVIRPYGFAIWEKMRDSLDRRIKASGHQNCYFPLFIPESFIRRESEHVEGFSPELAVVTHGGGKKLEEPLIVRPTSETIINEMFSRWISSYRDLPLLINQWANVVRWEMRTRLFLRTTEFLWQEGHTAHATKEEAEKEALDVLEMYREFMETELAIPVLVGRKSENERFAGALHTYACEALMTDGRALQMGTSHNLGQNFARAFGIEYDTEDGQREFAWQTSWGVSTRMVGGVVLAHGDKKGLVLPPRIAPLSVVIVPIYKTEEEKRQTLQVADSMKDDLEQKGVATKLDDRDSVTPGFKFNDWELRGVPIRLELGPRDIARGQTVIVRRDTGQKEPVGLDELADRVGQLLQEIQDTVYKIALKFREDNTRQANDYSEFKEIMDSVGGFVWADWCGDPECELDFKNDTKATIRVIPLGGAKPEGDCLRCGRKGVERAVFAKAY
jgi:prolyl-tRNA synthetase